MQILIIVLFSLYGLLIGSFLNVCIYRIPAGKNITTDRSHCPDCQHNLTAKDLVPVFSYLLLGRRCRYCRKPISARYAMIEIVNMSVYAIIVLLFMPQGADIALLKAALFAIAASSLIVWALIRFDRKRPPLSIYLWIYIPLLFFALLEQDRLLHLVGLLSVLLTALLLYLLRLWQLQLPRPGHEILGFTAGGMMVAWPGSIILASVITILLAILNVWKNSSRKENLHPERWLAPVIASISFAAACFHQLGISWFV